MGEHIVVSTSEEIAIAVSSDNEAETSIGIAHAYTSCVFWWASMRLWAQNGIGWEC